MPKAKKKLTKKSHAAKAPQMVELTEEHAQAFDQMERLKPTKQRGDAAGRTIKSCKQTLEEGFGASELGQLPDGRIVRRVEVEWSRKAQKAASGTYNNFEEVQAEPAATV